MKHIFKIAATTLIVGTMTFGTLPEAAAQTPPEVMTLYKEYRKALEAGEKPKASKKAYEAWQAAEKSLGDNKTTGDLAYNFADVSPESKGNTLKLHKQRVTAFKRSIELASFYGEDAVDMEVDRRLKLASHGIALSNVKKGQLVPEQNLAYFRGVKKAIDKYGKTGTTFEADYESLLANYYRLLGKHDTALVHANKAISIFENRTDTLSSAYFYYVNYFKADILAGMGDKIPAALQYQEVMQNLEGNLDPEHPFIKAAFQGWMLTRSELEEAGRLEEAEAAGLCECWPFENYKNKPLPLERVPPIMPRSAKRSGHVDVVFDIDEKGSPTNIESIYATESIFVSPSLKSVEKWKYSPLADGADPELRKGIAARVTFRLSDRAGKIIPARKL